ncbi:MAG: YciI family protein [Bdellovibrionales bacterium]
MLFVVRFTDKPGTQALRAEFMDAHLAWVRDNSSWILLAGALREAPEAVAVGGLWVVEALSREAAQEKLESDPFWAHGLRAGVDIYLWGMATPDMNDLGHALAEHYTRKHSFKTL